MATRSTRTRPTWPELPACVRAANEERLGGRVIGWTSHDGGYTPGLASTLCTTIDDVFVKAVPAHHEFDARAYREEAWRARVLPAGVPAPRLRWQLDIHVDQTWVTVAFDPVPGRAPATPLVGAELKAVVGPAAEIAEHEIATGPPGRCRRDTRQTWATAVPPGWLRTTRVHREY